MHAVIMRCFWHCTVINATTAMVEAMAAPPPPDNVFSYEITLKIVG